MIEQGASDTSKDFSDLCAELEKQYTPIISLEQWMFGETPCSKMISDMIKEKGEL